LSQVVSSPEAPATVLAPLCVDLDGTLVKSDTLVDLLLVTVRTRPELLLALPAQLLHGKAAFKAFITSQVALDVKHLPYNQALLHFLNEERNRGRALYLVTGSDVHLAEHVAEHLGIFTGVFASDGQINLTGTRKLNRVRTQFAGAFAYIGNHTPDLPLLANASESMVANPSLRLRLRMRLQGIRPSRTFAEGTAPLTAAFNALRPHQWAKNLLIFLPLLLAHVTVPARLLTALLAFFCFSFTASAAYIANDLLDIEADRRHPRKRKRPFAAGDLSALTGAGIALALLIAAFAGARLLPLAFTGWLLLYLGASFAYSWRLKRIALVDVLVLSGLYTLRLYAGSAATGSHISDWLAGFAVFLFFSLAIVKRFAELENLRISGSEPVNGRGYFVADADQLRSFGTSSAFAAVMVFAIYISSSDVVMLYRRAELLWLIVPLMILWLCRVWLLASRGELDEDPLIFAFTDRMSLAIGVLVAAIALLAI
jgi:4-hydroxybenzoate polyprenyltransferase/phosphoserine phosphatase